MKPNSYVDSVPIPKLFHLVHEKTTAQQLACGKQSTESVWVQIQQGRPILFSRRFLHLHPTHLGYQSITSLTVIAWPWHTQSAYHESTGHQLWIRRNQEIDIFSWPTSCLRLPILIVCSSSTSSFNEYNRDAYPLPADLAPERVRPIFGPRMQQVKNFSWITGSDFMNEFKFQ